MNSTLAIGDRVSSNVTSVATGHPVGDQSTLLVLSTAALAAFSSDTSASMVLQILCVLFTFSVACVGGWQFSNYYFTGGFKAGDEGARALFCGVFGICVNTIVLVLFELLNLLHFEFRLACLKFHIFVLVTSVLFVIPGYPSYTFFSGLLKRRAAAATAFLLQLALVYIFLKVAPQWPGVVDAGALSVKVAVLRTGVLGVCIMAVLSGFGVVDFPYTVMRAFIVPVSQFELHALQTQVASVKDQVASKQQRLVLLRELQKSRAMQEGADDRSWLGGMLSVLTPQNSEAVQVKELENDIQCLQMMGTALAADLSELEAEQVRELAAHTVQGAVMNVLGYGLSAYCVFKMFACLKSVIFGEDFTSDPVSRILAIVIRLGSGGNIQLNLQAATQWITLLFIGFLSINSLRAFLKHIRRLAASVMSLFSGKEQMVSSPAVNSRLMLVLAGLLSVYTISSVMLIRAQLPVDHRIIVAQALGFSGEETNIEFDAIHRWFNGVQLVSLLVSLTAFYWQYTSKKANSMSFQTSSLAGGYSMV